MFLLAVLLAREEKPSEKQAKPIATTVGRTLMALERPLRLCRPQVTKLGSSPDGGGR